MKETIGVIGLDNMGRLALARRAAAPARLGRALFGYLHRAAAKGWAPRDYTRLAQYLLRDPHP